MLLRWKEMKEDGFVKEKSQAITKWKQKCLALVCVACQKTKYQQEKKKKEFPFAKKVPAPPLTNNDPPRKFNSLADRVLFSGCDDFYHTLPNNTI